MLFGKCILFRKGNFKTIEFKVIRKGSFKAIEFQVINY